MSDLIELKKARKALARRRLVLKLKKLMTRASSGGCSADELLGTLDKSLAKKERAVHGREHALKMANRQNSMIMLSPICPLVR